MRLKKKPHARACWGPPHGYDTHGGSTTKQGIGEEAGESYGKTSFLPVLRRMSKVIHRHRETCGKLCTPKGDQAVNPKVFLGGVPLSFVCAFTLHHLVILFFVLWIRFPVRKSVSLVLSSVHILFVSQSCTACVFLVFRQSTVDSARTIHACLVHSCIQTLISFHSAIVRKNNRIMVAEQC